MRINLIFIIVLLLFLYGCASLGRGFAEGIMKEQKEPVYECRIYSSGFEGLKSAFMNHDSVLKILRIHGIGEHNPGYANSMVDTLADKLYLDIRPMYYKEIILTDKSGDTKDDLGILRVYKRYAEDGRTMIFYEYSWSTISEPLKKELDFDTKDLSAAKRVSVNSRIKRLFNDVIPDAVIYAGNLEYQQRIYRGLEQSLCWMLNYEWDNIPEGTVSSACHMQTFGGNELQKHKHVVISSSMGSQVALESLQFMFNKYLNKNSTNLDISRFDMQVFMLSNQIPLLSLGKNDPKIYNQISDYCLPTGKHYNDRVLDSFSIVAFSDPNDILTYTLSPEYISKHVDSRFCPVVSNVIIDVASTVDIIGFKGYVDMIGAHQNYVKSEKIIDLLVNGTNEYNFSQSPEDGCKWYLTTD